MALSKSFSPFKAIFIYCASIIAILHPTPIHSSYLIANVTIIMPNVGVTTCAASPMRIVFGPIKVDTLFIQPVLYIWP